MAPTFGRLDALAASQAARDLNCCTNFEDDARMENASDKILEQPDQARRRRRTRVAFPRSG